MWVFLPFPQMELYRGKRKKIPISPSSCASLYSTELQRSCDPRNPISWGWKCLTKEGERNKQGQSVIFALHTIHGDLKYSTNISSMTIIDCQSMSYLPHIICTLLLVDSWYSSCSISHLKVFLYSIQPGFGLATPSNNWGSFSSGQRLTLTLGLPTSRWWLEISCWIFKLQRSVYLEKMSTLEDEFDSIMLLWSPSSQTFLFLSSTHKISGYFLSQNWLSLARQQAVVSVSYKAFSK